MFFTETRSAVVIQRWFCAHFLMRWVPSFKTIHELYNQFNNDGCVGEEMSPAFICVFSGEH
jgi:hypothetical protein